MPSRVRIVAVPGGDRAELERRARAKGAPARVAERARIVLLAAEGLTGSQIARPQNLRPGRVSRPARYWRLCLS